MANNLHGCLGRLNGDYPRRQLALVGAHKLVHEIFKTPLFALVPGSTKGASPRLRPYIFKELSLQLDRSSATTSYPEDLNEIDDLYDVPSPYTSWPTSLSSVATNSDEDPSDGGSIFSSYPGDSTFDYSNTSTDHDISAMTSDAEDTCLAYGPSEQDSLVVTTMDPIDLFEHEIRVTIPRSQIGSNSSQTSANFQIVQQHVQDVSYLDIQTVLESYLFEETPNSRVRLPGTCTPDDSQAADNEDETPRMPSNASRGWGSQPSARLQHVPTSDFLDVSPESSQQWLRQVYKTEDKVGYTPQYAITPLQHPNTDIIDQHAFPTSEYSYGDGYFYPEALAFSFCTAGTDFAYNNSHDLHNMSYAALIPAYNMYPADTTTSFQPNHTAHSQASTLLSILNASSCPYTPSFLQPGNDAVVSSIGDPPIVKLAPIGHPTASPTPSSYRWPRSESSYNSTPNSSPISSPSTDRHVHENQVLSWPPLLYARRS